MTAMHHGRAGATRRRDGFSLIGLLTALLIFGVLFATVPPAYRD